MKREDEGLGIDILGKFFGGNVSIRGFHAVVGPDGVVHGYSFDNGRQVGPDFENKHKIPIETISDEKNGIVRLVAEVPGVEKENIDIKINERRVVINATREEKKYSGSTVLDSGVDVNSSTAKYTNGILEITFKFNAVPEGTKIEIQ